MGHLHSKKCARQAQQGTTHRSATAGRANNTAKAAFTLTEVLVAVALSVFAVASTYTLLKYSRNILRTSSAKLHALNIARAGAEYLRTLEFDDDLLEVSDDNTLQLNGKTMAYDVSNYNSNDDLKLITVRAGWQSFVTGSSNDLEIVTMVSSPLHTN